MGKKEYLVEGAKLICVRGSKATELCVPEGHNYDSGGKKKANCCDCIKGKNIKCFGKCSKNTVDGVCEGFMELEDKWINLGGSVNENKKVNGNDAITMDSILFCKKGGVIIPITSGQDYDSEIDITAFMKRYLKVMEWTMGQNTFCHVFGADPVNLNTGNYVYNRQDLYIRGKMPLAFIRYYNSLSNRSDSTLGEKWKHNYEINLNFSQKGEIVALTLEDGREVKYKKKIDGTYVSLYGEKEIFKKIGEKEYLYKSGGENYFFNEVGKISKISTDYGFINFIYNMQGQLEKAVSDTGDYLVYEYSKHGRLIKVSDNTGRYIEFCYSYGKLIKFVTVMCTTYSYTYNENGVLQSIVTPKGVCALYNEYDGANRIVKQALPDGGIIEFNYDDTDGKSYMKERNGSVTTYVSDEMLRNKKTIYEDGQKEYAYNDESKLTYYKDKNGNEIYIEYDNKGNKTKVIDGMKYETRMIYDKENRLVKTILPNGGTIESEYALDGKLIKFKDVSGNCREIKYNANGLPDFIINSDMDVMEIHYDEKGNIVDMLEGDGSKTSYKYDGLNRVIQTIDGNGNNTFYRYNDNDDLVTVVNAEGNSKEYQYDECGNIIKVVDYDGTIIEREYDICNRVKKEINKSGEEIKVRYDKAGNIIEQELPNGAKTKYKYNRIGKICKMTDALNNSTFYEYDGNGNLTKIINAKGEKTIYTYDACNRLRSKTEPDGSVIEYAYNQIGQLVEVVCPTGVILVKEYDVGGNLIKEKDMYGNENSYKYSPAGKLIEKTDWNEGKINYEYKQGLLQRIAYQNGCEELYKYDTNKNVIEWKRKNGDVIYYQYDCLNRIKTISNRNGCIRSFQYDAVGNVTQMTDANGNSTQYFYSTFGSLIQTINSDGSGMGYEYDDVEQIISVYKLNAIENNAEEKAIPLYSYEYDLAGHIKSITDALGNKERYEYDELGRLELKSDREGYDTRYVYGKNGKACEIRYGDGNIVKMSYTPLRQLAEIEDWLGKTQFIRNSNNKVEQVVDHRGQAVQYLYGDRGECNAIVYPDGSRVSYEYDECMRLKKLSFGEESVKYFYSGENLARKIYSNGVESAYQYDYADRISRLTYQMDHRDLEDYQYKYDLYGNKIQTIKTRVGIHEDSGNYNYEYNALNRLIKVYQNNELIRSYEYDGYGNRIRKWDRGKEIEYSYNEANQLVYETSSEETKEYTYDLRGNIIEIKRNGIAEKQYKFNAMNQLEKAVNGEGREAIYSYNGMGYRVGKKIIDNEVKDIHYLVNQTAGYNNRIGEDENGKIYKYIWDESIVCIENNGINSFVLTDEAGIPVRAMTKTGNTEEIFAMDEYGVRQKARNKSPVSFGISGYMEDEISGTFYAQVREYAPQLGRFLSEDKIGGNILFPSSFNQYDYCLGNPLIFVDLTGLIPIWTIIQFKKGVEAHNAIESYALSLNAIEKGTVYKEQVIKYGLDTKSGKGKVDIIYVENGIAEIYEIKKDSETSRFLGPFQLMCYVAALKLPENEEKRKELNCKDKNVKKGSSLNEYFNNVIITSPYNPSIQYELNVDENGVIYYKEIKEKPKPEPKRKPQEVIDNVFADLKKREPQIKAGLRAGTYMSGAVLLYMLGMGLFADDVTGVGIVDDTIAGVALGGAALCVFLAICELNTCISY